TVYNNRLFHIILVPCLYSGSFHIFDNPRRITHSHYVVRYVVNHDRSSTDNAPGSDLLARNNNGSRTHESPLTYLDIATKNHTWCNVDKIPDSTMVIDLRTCVDDDVITNYTFGLDDGLLEHSIANSHR